jgi:wobble nucleotide-excising tRNase
MALIKINLLPLEKQKVTRRFALPALPQVKSFLPLVIGLVALVIIIHLFLASALVWNKTAYNILSKKWNNLEPDKKEVDRLRNEAGRMDKKISLVEQLLTSRFSWTNALQSINECIVPGVWLSNFVLGEKTDSNTKLRRVFLSLSGSAVTSGGQGTATIGKFMNSLRENKDFASDFDEIELGSIQRRNIKETEIMDFTITAYFKKDLVIF